MSSHTLHLAVSSKPPRGAWSYRIVRPKGGFVDRTGVEAHASSYRLRLTALVEGLKSIDDGAAVTVVTTDTNTIQMATTWLPAWAAKGFRKKGIESRDRVMELAEQLGRLDVSWTHQPRRTGDPHAKDCKLHARQAMAAMKDVPPRPLGTAEVRSDVQAVAWTDGGSRTNPGPSGWGAVIVHLRTRTTLTIRGGAPVATNNRMELTAIAEALHALKRPTRIEVRTDSKFAIQVCTDWRHGWKRRGWVKGNGEPPVNLDVIRRLDGLLDHHQVVFTWVPGHTGEPGNERADGLCNEAIDAVLAGDDPALRSRADTPPFDLVLQAPRE